MQNRAYISFTKQAFTGHILIELKTSSFVIGEVHPSYEVD